MAPVLYYTAHVVHGFQIGFENGVSSVNESESESNAVNGQMSDRTKISARQTHFFLLVIVSV